MKTWQRLIAGAAALSAVAVAPMQAQAGQGLFGMLFGGGIKNRDAFPPPPPAPKAQQPKKAAAASQPAVRISGPEYYDFHAEVLSAVNFAALKALSGSASNDPQTAGTAFRESLTGLDGFKLTAEKQFAEALLSYYAANPDFIWITGGAPNERARAALRTLGDAAAYGLDPADYVVPLPAAALGSETEVQKQAELIRFEMTLSARVLRYLRDARGGRLDPNLLSGYHDLPAKPFDGKAELARMLRAGATRMALEAAHPQMPEYVALRSELASITGSSGEPPVRVDPDLLLNPGGSDSELPKVMQMISRTLPAGSTEDAAAIARFGAGETYGPELVGVVKAAQKRAGLRADGVIGPRTVKALAGEPSADRVEKVRLALEQLRWLPRTLGETRVFINEPAFTVSYMENGAEKLSMRAVVGKPTNQTSFFYDQIEQVDYNPYWGIPQSILVNEMLPRLRRDPGYLDRAGYEVFNAKGKRVPSRSVGWGSYGNKIPFYVRQAPSEANALGELKILFPNDHAIYMHDTPQKALFKQDMRAFSHGCVRLEKPRDMAAAVLGTSVDHVAEKLKQGHSSEKVKRNIPVYVAYFTAWPDASGKVGYFTDVYSRDEHLREALEKVEAARSPGS